MTIEDTFEAIAERAIQDAEQVECTASEFVAGLDAMIATLCERRKWADVTRGNQTPSVLLTHWHWLTPDDREHLGALISICADRERERRAPTTRRQ